MKPIDLRSDTVTKPTKAMLEYMFQAETGDDVYGEDPTVNLLEKSCAQLFGKEAGLFCPSGTMTNQIAIKLHTEPLSEVICDQTAHIYNYEGGGIAFNSAASVCLIPGLRGKITADQVHESIRPDNIHYPISRMVSLENTSNKGGGSFYTAAEIAPIAEVCRAGNLALHLDGARIFNALTASQEKPAQHGQYFDTISVCFSKGLGAPVGSVLLGTEVHIKKARRIRKVLGGGMRQAGYLAAAGIYALQNNLDRLAEDHKRARHLEEALKTCTFVAEILPVETNIVIFKLQSGIQPEAFLARLAQQNILASGFGPQQIRLVTHLDFDDEMLERTILALKNFA
ncbi:MAG TPA: GntG family PLP-dependent aldolase [Adhaeribacter sp.]|nr:GntG family PLP-dependent aldolase [Adhaeribacter sp.]